MTPMVSTDPDAEILVHITAPSRASDDVVYRQLAQAYLEFKPQDRQALPPLPSQGKQDSKQHSPEYDHVSDVRIVSPNQEYATPAPLPPLIDSQDLSFKSAVDNRSSPPLDTTIHEHDFDRSLDTAREAELGDQGSWQAPPSEIADSYPVPDRNLIRYSPTKALERFLGRPASRVVQDKDNEPPFQPHSPVAGRKVEVPSSQPSQTCTVPAIQAPNSSPDVVPSSPYMRRSGHRSSPENKLGQGPGVYIGAETTRDSLSEAMVVEETELLKGNERVAKVTHIPGKSLEPDMEPPLESRGSRSQRPKVISGETISYDTTSGLIREQLRNGKYHGDEIQDDHINELEIMPLSPAVSLDNLEPDDLVPIQLAKLAGDLSTRYRPTQKQEIEPLARGHWLLDCSSWPADHHDKTWAFLGRYIRSGLAGWGVWCRRDEAHKVIKMYCWGHLVKHTYLLLYLATERKLKTTGACWIGPSGELALEVQPQGVRAESRD